MHPPSMQESADGGGGPDAVERSGMKNFRKRDFPVSEIRRFLEPGPVVRLAAMLAL
jgi:hypothetical protein